MLYFPQYVACGEGGAVLVSETGAGWSRVSLSTLSDLEAVDATEDSEGYVAVGADGTVVSSHHFGGGTAVPSLMWSATTNGSGVHLRSVAGRANSVFATGERGTILTAHNASGPWVTANSGTQANLVASTFVGNSLFVVGENETILQSVPRQTDRLMNISSRGIAGRDAATLISGFVVQGMMPKQVLLRAVGPGLASGFNLSGVATAPQLTLFNWSGQAIAQRGAWTTSGNVAEIVAAALSVGAFPLRNDSADSAMLIWIEPGLYTTQVSTGTGASGLCLVEVYDADTPQNDGARAVNISTRVNVGTGDNLLIAGFVIGGESDHRVLIRAVGPALHTKFGLEGALAEPQLTLFSSHGVVLQRAGAWSAELNPDELRDAALRTGAFAFAEDSHDAALVRTLPPGVYTAQVTGKDNGTGVALVEVYDLP